MTEYQENCINYLNELTPATIIEEPKTGYVYCIKSPNTDKIYIGSTFKNINKRFIQHVKAGTTNSRIIIGAGDAFVELLEEVKCNNRNDLNLREGHYIIMHKENCVNKNISGRTLKESQKAYQDKYREWYREYSKVWRENNKERIIGYYQEKKLLKEIEEKIFNINN